jgi:hypothetical protein
MPRNGSGTFSLYTPGNPVVTGTTISSTWANNTLNDLATGLTNSLAKDGQTTPTANLPMGTFKLTGLGAGTAATDSLNLTQAQNEAYQLIGTIAGTDTITGSLTPNLTAYAAGQTFRFVAANTNTGAVTINIDGLGAKSITKNGTSALAAGDIKQNGVYQITYDGTQFQALSSLNINDLSPVDFAYGNDYAAISDGSDSNTNKKARLSASPLKDIDASVASNALTITINPTTLDFRSTTLTDGTPTRVTLTSAVTVVVPNTATLGTINATAARFAVLAINNAGTIEAAVVNLAGGNQLDETNLITTTTIGTGADSNNVIYSTTGRTNVAYRVVGFIDITEATAGVWATAPTLVQPAGGSINAVSIGFSKFYESPQQTITSAGALTLAHGLGRKPVLVKYVLQCTSAEGGYSIGDELTEPQSDAANRGVSIVPDATNINIRFGSAASTFFAVRKSDGVSVSLVNASWRFVVRAWA